MRENETEGFAGGKENEGSLSDWVTGGPLGSKATVLVFRSCVLASRTPSIDSPTRTVGSNTCGTTILLNKAKSMARRLAIEPNQLRPKNIMHDVMETFGNTTKYQGSAYIVQHKSVDSAPDESAGENHERKRDIEDVLNDLSKITLKRNLNIENTTANIKTDGLVPLPDVNDDNSTKENAVKHKKPGGKTKSKKTVKITIHRPSSPSDSEDSEKLLIKESSEVAVLDAVRMPARMLRLSYKLVNTETKLLHRLLQAHGLLEAEASCKEFSLLWSGFHLKPDVLRSLSQYQRVNHFPRSYELTRKDKLFKNIEKWQYFRGTKQFDFIPTTFLMPVEYKELCSTHYRTKGPWIVKPAASSRGRGIYIVNSPEQIPKGENVVVAKYVDKPLLIGGHKCDLRLYVCVTSIDPLLIYLYEEGLVRFATVKYDKTNKNLWNPCMHLCNYSINKYHTDYIKCDDANAGNIGHKWTLSALLRHLRKQGRDTTALMAEIEDLVVKSILSSSQTIATASRAFVPYFNNCFELFGYDILIDDMLKPWLLEINLSPSITCDSPLDAKVKSALLADTLTLVGLPAVQPKNDLPQSHHASLKSVNLKTRIGACRRVHSAENVMSRGVKTGVAGALTGEEARLVRAVKAQYQRRGGYVRIFPSQNSWQKYSQYLDPVSGIPMCSTSLNNGTPLSVVVHNYNLLVHSHVLPNFHHLATDAPERLQRYERAAISGAAPMVTLSSEPTPGAVHAHDARRAKELVKQQLEKGMKLTRGEGRRAFGLFLQHVLKRLGGGGGSEAAVAHAALIHRFLRRAALSLRMPYHSMPNKMSDKDRCAVVAKQLSDFLYMYHRETDLYTDSEDRDGCVSNIHFAQFIQSASEADLEDVLLLVLKMEHQVTTFLGDGRNPFCIDIPAEKLTASPPSPRHHLLLHQLACLNTVNTRRYRQLDLSAQQDTPSSEEPTISSQEDVVKESLKEEKPLPIAMKYARS